MSWSLPGEEIDKIRSSLEFQKATLISAIDEDAGRHDNSHNGETADRYGVCGNATFVMIDRQGNVAFHSGIDAKEVMAEMKAVAAKMGLNEATMTAEDFWRLWERYFSVVIDWVLSRP